MSEVIKRVKILKKDLPSRSAGTHSYNIRYRVVADAGNLYTHWSPIYNIEIPKESVISAAVSVDPLKKFFTFIWQPLDADKDSSFDVYAQWNNSGDWMYLNTVNTPNYIGLINDTVTTFKVLVQKPTFPKNRTEGAILFESALQTV
jgi:hypothetical protein